MITVDPFNRLMYLWDSQFTGLIDNWTLNFKISY